jgi:Rrf2 family iron-sulfur cluster assembly transcriptional regulator
LWNELGNQIQLYLSSVSLDDVIHRRVLGSSRLQPLGDQTLSLHEAAQ